MGIMGKGLHNNPLLEVPYFGQYLAIKWLRDLFLDAKTN